MIVPDRIGHVVIKVRDLERSRKFYIEVMGLKLTMEAPNSPWCKWSPLRSRLWWSSVM